MSKIIGITAGTPTSPERMKDALKPVQTVNKVTPDENGNVSVTPANIGAAESGHTHPTDTSRAPMYSYSTTDMTAGSSSLETGKMHLVYE